MPLGQEDFLWGLYLDNIAQARHHEVQRTAMVSVSLTLAGALTAVIGWDKNVEPSEWPMAALLLVAGLFGTLFSAKQHERAAAHWYRAKQFRTALEGAFPGIEFPELRKRARQLSREKHPLLNRLRLSWFFMAVHLIVASLGVVLLTMAIA